MAATTVIATTTAASGSGTGLISLGNNRWAVMVDTANGIVPDMRFTASWDAVTFVTVAPAAVYGQIFRFEGVAGVCGVSFTGNQPGNAITVTAISMSD